MPTPDPIDDYIAGFPAPIQERLVAMRRTIRAHAPQATERIAYRIPTFHQGGNLVHFAAFAHHIGFYPGPSGITAFADALASYRQAKGSVQFPHDAPLPLDLVAAIVAFRVRENGAKRAPKRASKRVPKS
ncbi:iron chaperone [Roseisolibacter agri]|uniref:YdhG-like domain-containing protein n=1 Tax=Roseisolibacter agri TaxID=2014610 RepID=A0AA37QE79_9BACT|nr:DUF1801 domain-containing protein [Roseisolibacter agri]GLC24660.1 hypothetical protein rosag_11730 [Roseisolibacter agri]